MALKLKKKFSLRKSTPDLSEWGKHDAKLIDALNKNDMHKINSVLTKKGISPTKLDPSGQSVFHRAAAENKPEALKIFIAHKADVNCRDVDDKTPLHYACAKGNVECMEVLLQAGASPLCEDRERQTPLHCAASAGYLDIIEFLMRVQDAPINKPNAHGQVPLHLATNNGHIKVCEELIRNGADVNMTDSSHRTALMLAASRGNVHLVQLFVKNGADLSIEDKKRHNVFWYAASSGKTNVEAFLRNTKPSPNKQTTDDGQQHVNLPENISFNGAYQNLDVRTSVEPISDEDLSDDDNGYLVPIEQHPSTSSKDLKPQYAKNLNPESPLLSKQQEDALKTDNEKTYEVSCYESQQPTAQRDRLGDHQVTNTAQPPAERIRLDIAGNYEKEIENLREMLEKEKEKTSKMEEKIQLLQSALSSPQPPRRIEPSTSEKDLRELSAFGDIQEAHEKEVSDLNAKIEELRRAIDEYCDENKILHSNRILLDSELSRLQSQITQLRVDTGSVPVDVDVEELIQNRMRIDEELKQVQAILENLRQTLPAGPTDGSFMQEVERLRRENATLQSDNRKLQLTISDIRSQLESLQELAQINKQLTNENSQLKDDLQASRSRKPVIIESSDELRQYNADLSEENERLHQDNAKLLAQVYQIQKDIEESMSKLPSIEEFLATKRENEQMKAAMARYADAIHNAATEKEDLKQKVEDMRVMLAAVKSQDQGSRLHDHRQHIMALKEMVERLKEQNDVLESEREQWSRLSELKQLSGESEFPHLQTENAALKEMVERQQQQIETMQKQNIPEDVEKAMKELSNKNKELELTVARLTNDLMALKSAKLADTPSSAADEDGVKLSSDVQVFSAVPQSSSTPDYLTEEDKLRSEIARLQDVVAQTNLISGEDTLELKQRNVALTEMVSNLKERNEILEQQLASGGTRTSSISSNEAEDKATTDTEILILREMIDRLKEENEILLADNLSQRATPAETPEVQTFEVVALREMVNRLKEQNEILQTENMNQQPRSWVKNLADDAKIIGMQEMIKRLKEENEILQLQVLESVGTNQRPLSPVSVAETAAQPPVCDEQPSDEIIPEAVDVVAAAPRQAAATASSLQKQVIALSEMVERLKERNDMLEEQLMSADRQSAESGSVRLHSEADADDTSLREENCALKEMVRRLREQNDILEQEAQQKAPLSVVEAANLNPKELIALKEMVIRLKEQAETLEIENERLRSLNDGQKVQTAPKDTDAITRENIALKEMIVRLKEQLDTQEQQILASKLKEAPRSSETVDNSELVRENTVLREMIDRLKEQLEIAASEQNQQSRLDADRVLTNKGALEDENTALKEIIEELKEQIVTLELELQASKQPALTGQSSWVTDVSGSSLGGGAESINEEILALREMVERLREEIEILTQYKDVGNPQVGDEVVQLQQVDILVGAPPDRAGELSALQKENVALTQMVNSLKEKCDQLESAKAQLEYNSSSEDEWGLDPHQQLKMDQLLREHRAQKEIIARLQEELEVCQASLENPQDSDFDSDRDTQPNINNVQYANNVYTSTNNKTEALEAMLASQKERIEILEAEQMAKKLNKPLDIWSDDAEKVKMRAEIERLEVQLAEAVKLSRAIDPSSDIVELRNMVNLLNERNKELEEQVVQVTTMNQQIGRQMAINEQLSARNKALEVMIAQLSGELTAGDSDQECIVEQTHVEAVRAAPKPSSSGETDLLHLREEKNALKEMVKSLKERIEILENELELEKERSSNSEVAPPSSDLESDNMRLREKIATLEGLLEEAGRKTRDDSDLRVQNTALQHVVESQKEKIESLEVELDQNPREVVVEVRDTKTITGLEQMIASQRERIEELESEIDQKPKEIIVEVIDTKCVEALKHIIENQKEQIENLQSELDQNPKEIYVEIEDTKKIDALQQMITSQKERIETLEAELCQKPREVKAEINRIDEAVKEMLASQKEHIENLESLLDQREAEPQKTGIDHNKLEALQQLVLSQKELIEDLESQLDQKPKEVVVHVEDVPARLALEEIIERQKEDIQRLEHELEQIPRPSVAEDTRTIVALKEMVESQTERIEDLEKELEQASVMIEKVVPTEAANQKIAALEQMLESLREQVSIAATPAARDEDMAEIIRLRGVTEKLLDENRSLQTALSSFREGYDGDQDDQELSLPEEITLVHAAHEQAVAPDTASLTDSDGGDRGRHKTPCQTKLAALIKENHALRAIVDSQAEHLEILAKELDVMHLSSTSKLEEERPDVQTQALREMVVSLTERIEILENETKSEEGKEQLKQIEERTAALATTIDCPEHETEIAALRQMVASQKERIEILEREAIRPDDSPFDVLTKESMLASESSKPEAGSHIEESKYPDQERTLKDLLERNENLSRINIELQNQLEYFEDLDRLAEELGREKDALLEENRELKEELFNLRQLATFGEELRRERDNAIEDRERIQEELSRLQDVLRNSDDIDRERYIWADERERLNSELLGLKKTIDEQTKLLDGSEKYTQSLQEDNKDLRTRLETLNDVVVEKDKELKRANERLNETEEALVRKIAQLQGLLSTKDQELKQQEGALADAQKQLLCVKEQLDTKPGGAAVVDEETERIMEENEALMEQNFELMSEIKKLRKEIEERVVPIVENTTQQAAPPSFGSSRSPATDDILQRENEALKEIISSLQERIDILEAQRETEAARNMERHNSTPGSESDGELKTEIVALREMVRSQNEQIEILQAGIGDKDESPRKGEMEDLKRETTSLREMLQSLQEENETLKATQRERSPVSANTDIEELQMKNEELIDENEQLHENIAHLQKLLQKASDEMHDDNTELLDENEYLKETIESLENEIDALRSHQTEDHNQDKALALEAMVERLNEERDSLEGELEMLKAKLDQKSESITANQALDDLTKENIALKAMIERLKEEIQAKDQTSDIAIEDEGRKKIEQSPDDLLKENIALKELVASLTDDKRRLEAELDNRTEPTRKPTTVPVAQLIEAPVYSEQLQASIVPEQMAKNVKDGEALKARDGSDSRDEEIVALKAMIERLKEENDSLGQQVLLQSHEVSSEVKGDIDSDELMKEITALKAMVDRLKEENEALDHQLHDQSSQQLPYVKMDSDQGNLTKEVVALKAMIEHLKEENEALSHQLHDQTSQPLPTVKMDSDQGDLTKEVVALKAMIEHLKEENEALSHQLHDQSSQQLPVIRSEHDQSDLVVENIALKVMIEMLKEEIQAKDQTSDIAIEDEGRKKIEQSSDDLLKENIALKELVASLTDDKRRLEAELDNRTEPTRKPTTVPVAQLIEAPVYSEQLQASIVPEQMTKNVKDGEDLTARDGSDSRDQEIVALKAMIEHLKEENESLSHQLHDQSSQPLPTVKMDSDQGDLTKEVVALKAMIEHLKEENESLSHQLHDQNSQQLPTVKMDSDQGDLTKEVVALKAMIEHLKEENESLSHQLHDQSSQQLPTVKMDSDQGDLTKEVVALKAMIEHLKEENEALSHQLHDQSSQPLPTVKMDSDQGDLTKEVVALKAMIEHLKEENEALSHQLHDQSSQQLPVIRSEHDQSDLVVENIALKVMIEMLKEEIQAKDQTSDIAIEDEGRKKIEQSSDDLLKENIALKELVASLTDDKRRLEAELDNRTEPTRKPTTVPVAQLIEAPVYSEQLQASIVPEQMTKNVKDGEDLTARDGSDSRDQEIVALKAMIEHLKEENESLSHQLHDQSSQPLPTVKMDSDQGDLTKEVVALKAMIEHLKEENESLSHQLHDQNSQQLPTVKMDSDQGDLTKEVVALKAMIERLKEENESLSHQLHDQSSQQLPTVKMDSDQGDLTKEVVALKAMIEHLKEENEALSHQLHDQTSQQLPTVKMDSDQGDLTKEVVALKAMIEHLKEENESLSHQLHDQSSQQLPTVKMDSDQGDLTKEVVALKAMIEHLKEENEALSHQLHDQTSQQLPTVKMDSDQGDLTKEVVALKAMIEHLKEENESLSHQLHDQSSQQLPTVKMDSDQGDLTKEVVALKAMIEHLKEENEALSHQLHDQSSQQLPVIRSEHDQSDLVKENIALKAMIERLKEEIQAKDQTSDIAIEDEGRKKIEQSSDDLLKENIALKELVASLTDDKRRLEAELDNRTEPTRKPTTVPVAQLIEAPVYSEQMQASIVPEQMAKNVKDGEDLKARGGSDSRDEEIVALKAMIERLKEENDVLSHQLQNQSSEVPSNVTSVVDQSGLMKENLALKAMIERLKEEIQSKDQDDSYSGEEDESGQKNDRSLNEILKENTALKAIIESLKEQLESLHDLSATQADRLQPGGHDAIETRTLPEQITETSLDEVGDINNLQKEIVALKAMIEQLKDENETLARQLEEQGSQFVSGVKEQSDLMKENSALKAMIERLKEEIDSFDQPRLPTTVADTADKKETTALKAMVENLKEDRDLLAKQLEQLKAELEDRKTDDGAGDSGHPNKIPSMETDVVRRENMALKAMLDRLKEQISILENERIMKESPELDKLTTENQILRADVCHLEEQLSKAKPERYEREIAALRETIERLKDESGEHRREEHSDLDDYSLRLKNFELRLEALQKERDDLLEQTMTFSEQIEEMQHEFSAKARKMQNDIDELIEENTNLKAALEKHPDVEQVKETFSAEVRSGQMQKEIEQLKDLLNSTAFEKIQLAGEIEQLKERIEVIQKELESKKQEAAYLQTENSDLRGLLATIQDTSKIPPDQLVARMKEENQKLQQFIQTLNDKVDRILSPEGMVVPVAQVEREKLSIENQLLTLQRQMEEERRKTREIVNTYRSHLLAAVQGQMDPEVKQALLHIIRLRGSTAGSRTVSSTSGTSEPIPGIDATSDYKV